MFVNTTKMRRTQHGSCYSWLWKTSNSSHRAKPGMPFCSSSLSKYQSPQILAKISEWFSEVEADPGEESVLSTRCWEEQAVCDELLCGWLPPTMKYVKGAHSCHLGASWIKRQGSCCPSRNPKSVLLDFEFSCFTGENKPTMMNSRIIM